MMLLPQEICWSNQRCPSPSWNWSIRFNPGKVTLFDFESGVLEFQFFWLQSWQVESACCFDHSSSRRSPVPLKTNFKLTNDTNNWIQLTCSVFVFLRHQPIDPLDNALHSSQKITFCCSRCEHVYILTIMWYIKLFFLLCLFSGTSEVLLLKRSYNPPGYFRATHAHECQTPITNLSHLFLVAHLLTSMLSSCAEYAEIVSSVVLLRRNQTWRRREHQPWICGICHSPGQTKWLGNLYA